MLMGHVNAIKHKRLTTFGVLVGLVVSPLWLFGCGDEGNDCDLIGAPQFPMVTVTVVDSASGAPAWWGANGRIEDGVFREDLLPSSSDPADSVSEQFLFSQSLREGVYSVTIEKPGYQPWVVVGVKVQKEGCFLSSHVLEARLQRTP
jgi:hypothetical protein